MSLPAHGSVLMARPMATPARPPLIVSANLQPTTATPIDSRANAQLGLIILVRPIPQRPNCTLDIAN